MRKEEGGGWEEGGRRVEGRRVGGRREGEGRREIEKRKEVGGGGGLTSNGTSATVLLLGYSQNPVVSILANEAHLSHTHFGHQ